MANFDHLTTEILKFWLWKWSEDFDHLTMTPGRRPNGLKIMVILTPQTYTWGLSNITHSLATLGRALCLNNTLAIARVLFKHNERYVHVML